MFLVCTLRQEVRVIRVKSGAAILASIYAGSIVHEAVAVAEDGSEVPHVPTGITVIASASTSVGTSYTVYYQDQVAYPMIKRPI
jgi:hypothetical protein